MSITLNACIPVTTHCYCHECRMIFRSQSAAVKHFKTFHASQSRCCECERGFISEDALDQTSQQQGPSKDTISNDYVSRNQPASDRHTDSKHHKLLPSIQIEIYILKESTRAIQTCQRRFAPQEAEGLGTASGLFQNTIPLRDLNRSVFAPSALLVTYIHHLKK